MTANVQLGKEGLYYHITDKGVQCEICPHECNLSDGQYGLCHSRVNKGNVLYSEAYAQPCALHVDPVEKKPLLHFHPGCRCLSVASTGCNFSCLNCQNWDISQAKPADIENVYLPPDKLIATCKRTHCPAIAYTYTEPITFYEYTYDCAQLAHENDIQNIIVSAGYINEEPLKRLCGVIDAANIDLKSFSDELYKKINRGRLQPVLNTLKILKDAGVWLEITNLLIPTVNDDADMIHQMCHWLVENGFENTPLHFSRFFPMYKMSNVPVTPLDTLLEAHDIAEQEGIRFIYTGNVSEIEGENTFCPSCHKLLVRRDGYRVLENHIKNGRCCYCKTTISGKW
jgi:pyruvate formate lyase activating enzyme